MTERQVLECMMQIAAKEYNNTGDEWWFELGVTIARKVGRRKNVQAIQKNRELSMKIQQS